MKLKSLPVFSALVALFAIISATGCQNDNSSLPVNAINAFDSDSFATLLAANAALGTLRQSVVADYPGYKSVFNEAASSYEAAVQTYLVYRTAPAANELQLSLEISNLTQAIIAMQDQFQADAGITSAQIKKAKSAIDKNLQKAGVAADPHANISLLTILETLEIAASVASNVPGTSPYAQLAATIISGVTEAVNAVQSSAGQPINVSLLTPIALIP